MTARLTSKIHQFGRHLGKLGNECEMNANTMMGNDYGFEHGDLYHYTPVNKHECSVNVRMNIFRDANLKKT